MRNDLLNLRKQLLELQVEQKKEKVYIKAKDGLYLVDFRTGDIKPIDIVSDDTEINIIDDVPMENILVCCNLGKATVIVDDVTGMDIADNLDVINVIPASKITDKLDLGADI